MVFLSGYIILFMGKSVVNYFSEVMIVKAQKI